MRPPLPLVLALGTLAVSACSGSSSAAPSATGGDRLAVTAGFYPYEFVAQRVGGDDVEVTNLTAAGAEPHDLELSPQQVAALTGSDLVVYARGFQPAVDAAVEQQAPDRALDVLTTVELLPGQAPPGGQPAGDPHVWLDPVRLATIAGAVSTALGELDPDRAAAYDRRARALAADLEQLDRDLRAGLADCQRRELVTSHDAFGYLAAAYGLEQVSLAGLSPEDEASPKRLAEVAAFARREGVTTVFFEELVSPKVAQSLAREVGAQAQVLSPLEGPPEQGDYLSAMRTNLESLRTALGCA